MDPSSRTGRYWIVWEERRGRWRLRGISRAAVAVTVLLAVLAAAAGVLIALTQAGEAWVGWAWAAWVLAVAAVGGRVLYALALGPVRRSAPVGSDRAEGDWPAHPRYPQRSRRPPMHKRR
ncbi:MAG: hypothetical protein QOF01_2762 [Thermomicrobiales bacterium]|nr:hypothetical protein [Thermomicrobiales bacterium]MEA2525211.1 hypothetical protein [Thermomicrobiales bacterium]MEA2529387.1 hypothetical protein [Thermomicrobiales bacterium]MEA2596293.1 hypothetical protein [Thermomicrobiales bacterium]